MFYGLYRPHTTYTAPRRFYDLYEGVQFPDPPGYLKNDLQDVPQQGNDWNVGRVLDALDKSAYADNTIVIFVSDNGFHNGTKNHWTKQTLWEQADGIPFLIKLPERKAETCSQTVSLVDLYPTLVEYCRLAQPKQTLDGKSLMPVLKDPDYKWDRPGLTTLGENYSSVRSERYRYIRYPDGSEELYDHQNDPYEHFNLAAEESKRPIIAKLSGSIPARFERALPDVEKAVAAKQNAAPVKKNAGKGKKGTRRKQHR